MEDKTRIIQEYVPGRQVTLAHQIANPQKSIYKKIGFPEEGSTSIGIVTLTPGETAIIAADIATKSADVDLGFVDRFSGTLVFTGSVSSVETALKEILDTFENNLKFSVTEITKS